MASIVEYVDFTKTFRGNTVVEGASFSVESGSVVGLLGPNGAGKSTILRGLVGLMRPTSGTAHVFGKPFRELSNPGRRVGVHMDGLGFETGITARRHLEICRLALAMPPTRVDDVLDEVELTAHADKRVGKFSTGMRQRLGLATALLGDPELLVLDEPANGLDPSGIRWLRGLIAGQIARGGTVLVSSHQLAEVAHTAQNIVVLKRKVLFDGTVEVFTDGDVSTLEESYFRTLDSSDAIGGQRV